MMSLYINIYIYIYELSFWAWRGVACVCVAFCTLQEYKFDVNFTKIFEICR